MSIVAVACVFSGGYQSPSDKSSYHAWPVELPHPPNRQLISIRVSVCVRNTVDTLVQSFVPFTAAFSRAACSECSAAPNGTAHFFGLDPTGEPVERVRTHRYGNRPGRIGSLLRLDRYAVRTRSPW